MANKDFQNLLSIQMVKSEAGIHTSIRTDGLIVSWVHFCFCLVKLFVFSLLPIMVYENEYKNELCSAAWWL